LTKTTSFLQNSEIDLISTPEGIEQEMTLNGKGCNKPNESSRVSPTSIVDLNPSELSQNPSCIGEQSDFLISSSSFDYVVKLKQLQHPLSESRSEQMMVDSSLTEQVRLTRTCTPRDTLILSSAVDDIKTESVDAVMVKTSYRANYSDTIESDDMKETTGENKQFKAILEPRSLRRFRSFPSQWNSKKTTSVNENNEDTNIGNSKENVREVDSRNTLIRATSNVGRREKALATVLKKQRSCPLFAQTSSSKTSLSVRFNEIMEVRYFYRSDDEIAIMKQCAIERRAQMELRRRLRRRFRKGRSMLLMPSTHHPSDTNNFFSFFGKSWTTAQQKICTTDPEMADNVSSDRIGNCGVPFECYDGDDDGDDVYDLDTYSNTTSSDSKIRKSWLETFAFPPAAVTGLDSGNEVKTSNPPVSNTTTGESSNFINHLADNILSIKLHDMFKYGMNHTKNESSSVIPKLDPVDGTPSLTTEGASSESSENTEPLWFVTALTCGNNTKLPN
jgi:hypothetical protein